MEIKKDEKCIFCYSLLFSNLKIEYNTFPSMITNCFLGHKKEIDFSLFLDFNNHSYDNNKLKKECPFCKEISDKDMFFLCVETKQLICPKCIALNIIILSSKGKKDKTKKTKKSNNKQPHYSTLISLLKESLKDSKDEKSFQSFNEKNIEDEKKEIIYKYNQYKEIIIDEKEQKYLKIIYNFIINLNCLKKKAYEVYIENKNYLSKYFYENIKHISSYNNIKDIFINNFSLINKNIKLSFPKELFITFKILNEYLKINQGNDIYINRLSLNDLSKNGSNNKNIMKNIYQQESIISHILYFTYELDNKEIEKYLIISSNNGIINVLDLEKYKSIYILDIFQNKGIYNLIQCENEKNVLYASSWGCFKKIKLIKEDNKETNTITFKHIIIKTYKKSDIIRILKLIEILKNTINQNIQNDVISLDEGGHIIVWGYNEEYKKDTKEEIFVADREDSINNMILFKSNKLRNMLIFTTRNSTLLGSIYFYNIQDGFYELKCLKNKFKSKTISFDLQYNTLTQISDYMIVFPQNKKLIFIDVKSYQIATIIEMEIDLVKDKFYNSYGETIGIIDYKDNNKKYFLVFSSKGYIFQYYINDINKEIIFKGKNKYDFKEEIESIINSNNYNKECEINLNKEKLYIKFNKKILLIDVNNK